MSVTCAEGVLSYLSLKKSYFCAAYFSIVIIFGRTYLFLVEICAETGGTLKGNRVRNILQYLVPMCE